MRETTTPPATGTFVGKNRNPFAVWFLSFITFGIYFYYWYYQVNHEIGRHEPGVKSSAGVSLLAVSPLTVFTLFISALVSMYNTATRIQRMEMADSLPNQISPLVSLILLFFFGIGYYFQIQGHLNAHWDRHRMIASGRIPGLGPAAALPAMESPMLAREPAPIEPPTTN